MIGRDALSPRTRIMTNNKLGEKDHTHSYLSTEHTLGKISFALLVIIKHSEVKLYWP